MPTTKRKKWFKRKYTFKSGTEAMADTDTDLSVNLSFLNWNVSVASKTYECVSVHFLWLYGNLDISSGYTTVIPVLKIKKIKMTGHMVAADPRLFVFVSLKFCVVGHKDSKDFSIQFYFLFL